MKTCSSERRKRRKMQLGEGNRKLHKATLTEEMQAGTDFSMKRAAAKFVHWLPGVWMSLLVSVSLAPWIVKRRLGITGVRHSRGHVIAFFLTAIVFTLEATTVRGATFRAALAGAAALLLESLEVAVFGNQFEWNDVRMDLLGIACGLFVILSTHLMARAASELS